MDLRRSGPRAVAALKELEVRPTSSMVRLIHSESMIIDSVDDGMVDFMDTILCNLLLLFYFEWTE